MKKASNVRLSLRKLFIAMMAVGPVAVLPSSLVAAVPIAQPFDVTSGTATWAPAGNSATIDSTNRAVLVWDDDAFNIATGETFNFTVPSGGAVLNKVGYLPTGGLAVAPDDAIIDGTLFSTGRVFVLANGNISVGGGANIITLGGLVLSTLEETSDFGFSTSGNLSLTGNSTGNITLGNATNSPTVSGSLEAYAGGITSHGGSVAGDLVLRTVTADGAIDIAASNALAVSGNLSVITNNGVISSTQAVTVGSATGNQTTTLSTGASGNVAITLNNAANNFEVVSLNVPGADGDVTLVDTNIITLGAGTVGGDLNVTAGGNLATSGAVQIGGNANLNTTGSGTVNFANNSTLGGTFNATTGTGSITANTVQALTTGAIAGGGVVTLTSQGALNISDALSAAGNVNLTGNSIAQTAAISTSAGRVTYNATTGGISIGGTVSAPNVTINSSAGNGAITQSAGITTTGSGSSILNSGTGNITLNSGNAFAAGQVLQITGATVAITNGAATTIGTTNTTGNLTINTGGSALTLGAGAGTEAQDISVGGVLAANTGGGAITDANATAFNVFGGLDLTTNGGTVELDAAFANGAQAPSVQLGSIDIDAGAGNVTIGETSGLNLGDIVAQNLNARSAGGPIVDSGEITLGAGGVATFTVPATQSVVIDESGHTLPVINVIGGNDNSILVDAQTTLGDQTAVTGNLTLASSNNAAITIGAAPGTIGVTGNLTVDSDGLLIIGGPTSVTGNLSLTSGGAITDGPDARLVVSGVTTLAADGNVTFDADNNDFNSVVLDDVGGDVSLLDVNNLSLSGTSDGGVFVVAGGAAGAFAGPWALTLGNLNVESLEARASNAGAGVSGSITQQAGTSMHVETDAAFFTNDANITLGNNGNSFGRVSINTDTGASSTVTLVEDATLKLGFLNHRGAANITSRFGSILEDTTQANVITNNGTLTLNAPNGSILLGGTTGISTTGNVTAVVLNAPNGAAAIITNNQVALGAVDANSLTVTATNNITQTAAVRVFGSSTFNSTAGNIVLTNSDNNFGRVSATVGGVARNITLTEASTLNLGTVSMPAGSSGNFTATSVGGDIIDTGLGGVKAGGTIATPGSGVITLNATEGDIILDDPTTDFPTTGGVVFNAENVTLSPLGQSTVVLGAAGTTSTAETLTVTSAIGNIMNAGDLNISGAASFQTGNGNITLGQSGNRFGTVRFIGNQVSISQSNDMNIVRGSAAIGQAQLASTGSYLTIADGTGVVSFGNNVTLTAATSIDLPKAIQAVGTLTVNAAGTKDLGALSISGDLGGNTPVNLGTGTYVPPQP